MKHSIRKALLLAGFCLLGALSAAAQPFLRLPAIIGDHMVLQEKPPSGCTAGPIPTPR